MGNLESHTCFELWEEAGVQGENPLKHKEKMQSPHRKEPSFCVATSHCAAKILGKGKDTMEIILETIAQSP